MKRAWCSIVLLILAATSSFAENARDRNIYIEGIAENAEHYSFFMKNFKVEAEGFGYTVVADKVDAAYTFRFEVEPYDSAQFIIQITLFYNDTSARIVSFSRLFNNLEEMNEYTQLLFFNAIVLIPKSDEGQTITEVRTVVETAKEQKNDDWRNKWLYVRASFDYPVTFYLLKGNGLIDGVGVYEGTFDSPTRVSSIDNRVYALPGATLGAELQFLDFMSAEFKFQISMETLANKYHASLAAGADLKFPLKFFDNFVLEPYGTLSIPLNILSDYSKYPLFAAGGGIQFGIKGGSSGVFFIDVNYMVSLSDAVMKNPYEELYPQPKGIHYRRSVLGLGIGYKYGFFNRKQEYSQQEPTNGTNEYE